MFKLFLVLVIYFAPTVIAYDRKTNNIAQVFIVDLLLGWSILGWIAALIMAYTPNRKIN